MALRVITRGYGTGGNLLVSAGYGLLALLILDVPADRLTIVRREERVVAVTLEERDFTVQMEARILELEEEGRIITVEREDRTVTIALEERIEKA